jgi:hypothetical protein
MGDSYQTIVDLDATEEEARHLGAKVRDWLLARGIVQPSPEGEGKLAVGPALEQSLDEPWLARTRSEMWTDTNALRVQVGRTVFFAVGVELKCRACGHDFEPDNEAWGAAVDAWYEGDDTVKLSCLRCGHSEKLTEWDGPNPWAFAHLGFEFWNWPHLSTRFVREVVEQLGGHRVRLVCSKL